MTSRPARRAAKMPKSNPSGTMKTMAVKARRRVFTKRPDISGQDRRCVTRCEGLCRRLAEVALGELGQPIDVPQRRRSIQAQLTSHLRYRRRSCVSSEDCLSCVSREDFGADKDENRDDKQRQDRCG